MFKTSADYWRYVCEDCGADLDDDKIEVERWTERTEAGPMPCVEFRCRYCGSDCLTPAHECNNKECEHYAREGKILCDECFKALATRYVAFIDSLTPAELEAMEWALDGNGLAEVAETFKKGGWVDADV